MTRTGNALAAKLSRSKVSSADLEDRLEQAEAEIAAVAASFTDWVAQDLATAQADVEKLRQAGGDVQSVKNIFRIVHDMKGQGGTFGYNLVTTIAAQLCDFIRSATRPPTAAQLDVISGHLMALEVVIGKDIKGDGDDAVRCIVEKLALAASRVPALR